jgi:hypothetical protein
MSQIATQNSFTTARRGEKATVLNDLPQPIVERLAGIGDVEDLADIRRELQERDEAFPGCRSTRTVAECNEDGQRTMPVRPEPDMADTNCWLTVISAAFDHEHDASAAVYRPEPRS